MDVKTFIETFITLIDNNDYTRLYQEAIFNGLTMPEIGQVTEALMDADEHPLDHMNRVPIAYFNSGSYTYVHIPSHIESIGERAFADSLIRTLDVPGSVDTIDYAAFAECTSLKKVKLNEGVRILDNSVFYRSKVEQVYLPQSLRRISRSCFELTNLKSVQIPEHIDILHPRTFAYCSYLENVYLPRGLKKISADTFDGCIALTDLTYEGTSAEWENIRLENGWLDGTFIKCVHCSDKTIWI